MNILSTHVCTLIYLFICHASTYFCQVTDSGETGGDREGETGGEDREGETGGEDRGGEDREGETGGEDREGDRGGDAVEDEGEARKGEAGGDGREAGNSQVRFNND